MRIVLQAAGVRNGYGKQLGTNNRLNNARACVATLASMRTPRQVGIAGGLKLGLAPKSRTCSLRRGGVVCGDGKGGGVP